MISTAGNATQQTSVVPFGLLCFCLVHRATLVLPSYLPSTYIRYSLDTSISSTSTLLTTLLLSFSHTYTHIILHLEILGKIELYRTINNAYLA
ncbi:hypothetical protein F5Y14DRAFT_258362 [Nemania sp. NC0429]|nr:hypothetical protein F5Y14DRAFT_258362 [Nemania sp. NC0429]